MKAQIKFPDGKTSTVSVKSWSILPESDTIKVIDKSETVYLTHSSNVILLSK